VRLETNTVDLDVSSLETLDKVLGSSGLGAGILNVVVIVVELDLEVVLLDCSRGGSECNVDVVRADGVEPDVRSPGGVVGKVASSTAVAKGLL
jgi:hypothetical protein